MRIGVFSYLPGGSARKALTHPPPPFAHPVTLSRPRASHTSIYLNKYAFIHFHIPPYTCNKLTKTMFRTWAPDKSQKHNVLDMGPTHIKKTNNVQDMGTNNAQDMPPQKVKQKQCLRDCPQQRVKNQQCSGYGSQTSPKTKFRI